MSQKDRMTLEQYLDEFLNQQDVFEQCGGDIGLHPGLTDIVLKENSFDPKNTTSYSSDKLKEAQRDAKEA
eukprot:14590851-Ditylum_brightwellii.AAC.2